VIERSQEQEAGQSLITVFSVGEIKFAIKVENLSEIIQFTDITVGSDRKYMLGTVELRGVKVPILDLEKYFGIGAPHEIGSLRSMIIVKKSGGDGPGEMGMIVDRIEGVHRDNELTFFSFPEIAQNNDTAVYQGMLLKKEDLILFLDTPRLMELAWASR
jgi:chemotaxis signal transduction protein